MRENTYRSRIRKIILWSLVGLILMLFLFWILKGFDSKELTALLRFYLPIKSVYIASIFKHLWATRIATTSDPLIQDKKLTKAAVNFSNLVLIIYLGLTYFILIFKATGFGGEILTFEALLTLVAIIEATLGAIIGVMITDLFNIEKKNQG